MFLNMSFQQRRPRLSDTMMAMWRMAEPADDDRMVELCRGLYDEDPGPLPVPPANMRATLEELRRNANGVLWATAVVGIALGVTPDNSRARRLYERLGFTAVGFSMVYRIT